MTYPATGSINLMELWNLSDQASERKMKKFLETGLDTRIMAMSKILGRIPKGPETSNPVIRWYEENAYVHKLTATLTATTLAISGYLQGAAVTQDSIQRHVRPYTILQRPTDGLTVQVTSIAGILDGSSTWDATVAEYGNSGGGSLSDDSGAVEWWIIGEPAADADDWTYTRALDRDSREVGTQIFEETFEIGRTRENTSFEIVGDDVEHQIRALTDKMTRGLALGVINGFPYYSSSYKYGNQTQRSTMCSLWAWPKITQAEYENTAVFVNLSSAEITKDNIDDLILNMMITEYANFEVGDWAIICNPAVYKYVAEFDVILKQQMVTDKTIGYKPDMFQSKYGPKIPILVDQYVRPGVLQIVNFSKLKYGYYKNDTIHRDLIATQGRYKRWMISFQCYGLVCRDPRANIGTIYGIATS